MKTEYSNRSFRGANSRKSRSSFLGAIALLVAIGLLFAVDRFSGGIIHEFVRATGGAARSLAASGAASITESGFFASRSSLARDNEELRREIALHAERIAQAEFLRSENDALKEMARLAEDEAGISARIVSSFESSPYGTFLIDAGSADGVQVGSIVLTPGGFILGEVTSVSGESASVHSLFSPQRTVALFVGDAAFTADGQGGGNARAEVAREMNIPVGAAVVAPQYGGRNAGTVMHVETASSSATAILSIRIPVNLDTLRFVYVVGR